MKLETIVDYLVIGIKVMVIGLLGAIVMFPFTALTYLGVSANMPLIAGILGLLNIIMIPVGLIVAGFWANKIWKWK